MYSTAQVEEESVYRNIADMQCYPIWGSIKIAPTAKLLADETGQIFVFLFCNKGQIGIGMISTYPYTRRVLEPSHYHVVSKSPLLTSLLWYWDTSRRLCCWRGQSR